MAAVEGDAAIQLNSVEALLSDAEEKLIEDNTRVDKWAQKARFAIFDAEDLLDGILADVPGFNKVRTNIIDLVESSNSVKDKLKYKLKGIHPFKKAIEEELSEIIERLQFIAAQKDDLGLKEKHELATYRKGRLSTSLANVTSTIYGRSEDKEMIIRLINSREGNDDALRVIPIVGMGGIGKTTLAGMVFHEYKSVDNNSSNGHVFEVKGWACVSDEFDAARVIKSLLESITGQESKLNNSFELLQQELKIKLQSKRFLIILDDLWSEKPHEWDALRTSLTAGAIGSRVIVTTRSKKVAHIVCTCSDFFYGIENLGEDESWSLFETIVFSNGNSSAYLKLKDIGKEIVRKCKGLPLAIKMIGGLLVSNGYDENEWRNVLNDKIWENTNIIPSLRLSYFYLPLGIQSCFAYCSIFPKDYLFSMEDVIMLWVGEGCGFYFKFKKKLFGEMMSNFRLLRVLSLNGYNISTLPKSVGDMKLLRLLDLSCTQIDHLPDMICRLYNLQILLLSHCEKLRRLPAKICNLVNLRHLNTVGTEFEEMPDGIGRLTNIQTLSNFVISRGKSKQMREFKGLSNLHGVVHISKLNNVEDTEDVVIAGFKHKEYLKGLVLKWEATGELDDEKVLDAIEAHKNLKSLTIQGYGGKKLSDWIVGMSPSFTDLVALCVTDCVNFEALPPLGNLPFLRNLEMERLDRVESFGEEFYGDSDTPFQSLEKLTIIGMKALKKWCFPGGNVRAAAAFQALEDVQIESCPQLTKIPYCFPSLSRLLIESCDNLVKFAIISSTLSTLLSLQTLHINGCNGIRQLPTIYGSGPNYLTNLSDLRISDCGALECLPDGFHKAATLHTFCMDNCPNLCFNKDRFPVSLRGLCISDCGQMKLLVKTVLPTLTSLTHLELRGFPNITTLDHCIPESVQTLKILSFPRLKSLTGVLPNLKHLRKLEVEDCPRVDPKSWGETLTQTSLSRSLTSRRDEEQPPLPAAAPAAAGRPFSTPSIIPADLPFSR
uniref:Uncharacterized protein n=1 Tax=Kalanchoe fedtschenkoi TaxID=63787 RepID=A0A7N0RDJ2_KALFE